MRQVTT